MEIIHLQVLQFLRYQTFQVNLFTNNSGNNVGSIFEPGLDRDFTLALQNILENQTNLQLIQTNGDFYMKEK